LMPMPFSGGGSSGGGGGSPLSSAGGGLSGLKPPELGGMGGMPQGLSSGAGLPGGAGMTPPSAVPPAAASPFSQGLNAGLGGAPAAPLAPPVTSAPPTTSAAPCRCGLIWAHVCSSRGRVAYINACRISVRGTYLWRTRNGWCDPGGCLAAVRL
jgi:hypothetical protein